MTLSRARWAPGSPPCSRSSSWFVLTLVLVGCSALGPTADPTPAVRGPLPSRTQHPLALTFLALRPRRAAVQPEGSWGFALDGVYSSIFEVRSKGVDHVAFDGEILRTSGRARYGINGALDVEVELAAVYATGGFLDSFVDDFHAVTNTPGGDRDRAPKDAYEIRITRSGEIAYELEGDHVGIGDLPVTVTGRLRGEEHGGPALSWRFGVELPTGSVSRGYGSGGVDFGGGLLVESTLRRWSLFGALDYVVTDEANSFDRLGIEIRNLIQVQGGVEYRWNDRLSLLGQLFLTTPLTSDIELEEINREIVDLGLGLAYDFRGGPRITGAFHEDVVAATGPDFSLFLGVSWNF